MIAEPMTDNRGRTEPQMIPVNMYETSEAVVVVAAVPGVRGENIEVETDGHVVTVRAELRTLAPKSYLLHEWSYGDYERSVGLPVECTGPVTASLGQGQLAISIAKTGTRESDRVRPTDTMDAAAGPGADPD